MDNFWLNQGVLGALVLAEFYVIYRLYTDKEKATNKLLEREQQLHSQLDEVKERHYKELTEVQIALNETRADLFEQIIREIKEFNNRLISLATSNAEINERTILKQNAILDAVQKAFRAIETKLDERITRQNQEPD